MKKLIAAVVLLLSAAGMSFCQNLTFSCRYKVNTADKGNYTEWNAEGSGTRDTFDALSGASVKNGTSELKKLFFDKSLKKKSLPYGLYGVLLYPLSRDSTAEDDDFTVYSSGKQVIIRFVHRGTAYQLKTDKDGYLDVEKDVFYASGLCENHGGKFHVKKQYLLPGADDSLMSSIDWSKVAFIPDIADKKSESVYAGKLKISYDKIVLTIKGTLKQLVNK